MSIEAIQAAEVQVENVADLAQFIAAAGVSQGQQIVQVSDVTAPILQVQDAIANGTIIQVSESAVAPLVQVTDQTQGGVFIADGLTNGIQILDGNFPIIQGTDGNIIQLAQPIMSGGGTEGLTQVVQFANGQIALIEQQENIDPQSIQHLVFEQVPPQQVIQAVDEASQAVQTEARPQPVKQEIQPPVGKGPYKCETCDKEFPKWNQLQRHIRHHEEDKPHQCIHCPSSFNILENLKLHEATHVEEGQMPQCPECSKKFSRVASLKAHIMLHEREESLMCAECGDEFALQGQLDRHLKEHRDAEMGQKVYTCRQCTQEFTKPALLKEHMKQHYKIKTSLSHKTYKKVIDRSGFSQKCPHCMKSFQKPSQLERHIRIHTGERPFKCSMCSKAFNQKGALQIHMTKHTGIKSHNCQFCTQTFAQKGNLRAHIQRVHTLSDDISEGTVFHCEQCSCVFKKLGSLNAHISRFHTEHSDLPPHGLTEADVLKKEKDGDLDKTGGNVIQHLLELSEAGASNSGQKQAGTLTDLENGEQQGNAESDILQQALVNSGLPGSEKKKEQEATTMQLMNVRDSATGVVKKHLIRKVGGVRWHQCTYCTKEFKKPSDLVRHIRIHSHEKPYKCNQCFRAFAVKSTLTAHIRTHTGIKHFKCNACDKLFSTHGSLKVHTRLHTGAKPFECPHCDKKFRTAAHKKSHVMQHFKDGQVREKVRERRRRIKQGLMSTDIPLQEPILITDTGLIQQPPRNNLLNHYLGDTHSVDRPYKCTYCQRGFKKSSHLKQHVRSHTGEKPYKCQQCGRTFVSNGVLKAHIRIHTGVKHYKCLLCETMFTTNGSLKRHMSTHSEVRPFMCPYCQKTFKTSVNCKKHMKTHRHELALQSTMEQQKGIQLHPTQDPIQTLDHEETHPETEETSFAAEATQNELDLGQQDLNSTSMMSQTDLSQQSILSQANLQDALGLGTGGLELQQTLNQQIFGQQQTYNQSLLGSGQQNFQAINNQMNSINQTQQFSVQSTGINQLDINTITNPSFGTEAVSQDIQTLTNITNIPTSQTSEEDNAVQQINTVTEIASSTMQSILQPPPTSNDIDDDDGDDDAEDSGAPAEHVIARDTSRKFHCEDCNKSFKKSSHLKQHIRSHTGERPYRCAVCGRCFIALGVLRAHLRTHSGVKEFKCHVCNAMFTTNGSLTRHMNAHASRKELKCTECDKTFWTDFLLKRHIRKHMEGEIVDKQGAVAAGGIQYIHVANGQLNPGPPVDTTLSEKILMESASEKNRISEVRELQVDKGEKHPNQCPHCIKSFKKPSDLVRHLRIHTGEKPYACPICSRKFTVKSTLDSHMKTHGGIDKTIKCHICSSMFSTKGSLKVHMRLHTGAKPFRCPHCSQRFRTSGHRKSHILSHYKPESSGRKRKSQNSAAQQQTTVDTSQENFNFLNNVDMPNNMVQQNQGQVINIDPALLQGSNILPLSLTVDNFGNIADGSQAAQLLQGSDGIQLQLTGVNLPQGVQITGLDPSMFQQTVQIDANLLQQLQNGNVNISVNPNQIDGQTITAADPNMVQNIQIQQIPMQDQVNPNMIVQHPSLGQVNIDHAPSQPAMSEVGPNSFVVAADGSFTTEQQIGQPQVADILNSQTPQSSEVSTDMNTNLQDDTQQSENISTSDINTGNTELANTASNIEQTGPNEMDSIDPNITQNIANISANIGTEADNEDIDSDDGADIERDAKQDSDDDENLEMVHESVGDDMPHETLVQANLDNFEGVTRMPPPAFGQVASDRTHHCGICNKSFKRAGHLKEHVLIHEQKYRRDKPTPHKCIHCEKSFQKPSQLERHVRIHTGERPFQCKLCGKSFNQKNALQIHLKKHSGDKPHKCTYCDNAFTQKGNLKTHIKRAHHSDMVHSMKLPTSQFVQANPEAPAASNPTEELNLEEVADLF